MRHRLCTDACEFHSVLSEPWATTTFPYRLAFPINFKQRVKRISFLQGLTTPQ
jgi:hypothetical protein